jgi:hypothetical protein
MGNQLSLQQIESKGYILFSGQNYKNLGGSRTPLMQEQQGWYSMPHGQLVKAFQDYIQEKGKLFGGRYSPVEIIRMRLDWETKSSLNKEEMSFYFPLRFAWDALAYDRYEPGSLEERKAGAAVEYHYHGTHEQAIKLSHPLQVRIIDALTEAVGIPHQKGQAEIEIPKNLKHYHEKWIFSKEYQERLAKARK